MPKKGTARGRMFALFLLLLVLHCVLVVFGVFNEESGKGREVGERKPYT